MLPRSRRLVSPAEHQLVARRGRRGRARTVTVGLLSTRQTRVTPAVGSGSEPVPARGAVVVSKQVGCAVIRNRVRRQLRHLLAPHLSALPAGTLVVVRAQSTAALAPAHDLSEDLASAMTAAGSGGVVHGRA